MTIYIVIKEPQTLGEDSEVQSAWTDYQRAQDECTEFSNCYVHTVEVEGMK